MKKIKFTLLAVFALLALAVASCSKPVAPKGLTNLTDDTMLRPDKKVPYVTVLDFNAVWCIPCKKLTPAFDKVAEMYPGEVAFYTVDIDNNPLTKEAFGVENVPTVIILSPNGDLQRYESLTNFVTEEQLMDRSITADQLTDIIADNLNKDILKALGK